MFITFEHILESSKKNDSTEGEVMTLPRHLTEGTYEEVSAHLKGFDEVDAERSARLAVANPTPKFTYDYPMAANTVDAVVFNLPAGRSPLNVLLIRRGNPLEPFYNCWALPGGFVNVLTDPTLIHAVLRELQEETGLVLSARAIEQLETYGDMGRDSRSRVISTAYMALVREHETKVGIRAADDASELRWFPVDDLPQLAFDHARIIQDGLDRLRKWIRRQPVWFELLEREFTMADLQHCYEAILGRKLNARQFCGKIVRSRLLVLTGKIKNDSTENKWVKLYRFDKRRYRILLRDGLCLGGLA